MKVQYNINDAGVVYFDTGAVGFRSIDIISKMGIDADKVELIYNPSVTLALTQVFDNPDPIIPRLWVRPTTDREQSRVTDFMAQYFVPPGFKKTALKSDVPVTCDHADAETALKVIAEFRKALKLPAPDLSESDTLTAARF